jgi:hypothetical protein
VNPFADLLGATLNLPLQAYDAATGSKTPFRFPTDHTGAQAQMMDSLGVPKPETRSEKVGNFMTQLLAGSLASAPLTGAIMGRMGLASSPAQEVAQRTSRATREPARLLQDAGVPLDRAQQSGSRFANMVRSATVDHPFTVDRAAQFTVEQQKGFNRAVLRSIGESADEATQSVMARAYQRIGSVFNEIGRKGAAYDTELENALSEIVDDAARTVPESALAPLGKNVDDILKAAADGAGKINGEQFIKIRSHLSALSDNPDVGVAAEKIEKALLDALERTHPGERAALQAASQQWRSMRIIQAAIGKGAERNVNPIALSNAIANRANQAMSVYGMGGDQHLVALAQAARTVLPEILGNSGTGPRGLMQAPLRAIATAPLYKAGQAYLLSGQLPAGGGVTRNALAPPVIGTVNALANQARQLAP